MADDAVARELRHLLEFSKEDGDYPALAQLEHALPPVPYQGLDALCHTVPDMSAYPGLSVLQTVVEPGLHKVFEYLDGDVGSLDDSFSGLRRLHSACNADMTLMSSPRRYPDLKYRGLIPARPPSRPRSIPTPEPRARSSLGYLPQQRMPTPPTSVTGTLPPVRKHLSITSMSPIRPTRRLSDTYSPLDALIKKRDPSATVDVRTAQGRKLLSKLLADESTPPRPPAVEVPPRDPTPMEIPSVPLPEIPEGPGYTRRKKKGTILEVISSLEAQLRGEIKLIEVRRHGRVQERKMQEDSTMGRSKRKVVLPDLKIPTSTTTNSDKSGRAQLLKDICSRYSRMGRV